MEKSNVKERIMLELETLISKSCKNPEKSNEFKQLHIALLKKHYNATNVSIDYHRHRIKMDVILDDTLYNPKQVNFYLPTIYTNLLFKNLKKFLKNSIDYDSKSLGFYAQLLKAFGSSRKLELI